MNPMPQLFDARPAQGGKPIGYSSLLAAIKRRITQPRKPVHNEGADDPLAVIVRSRGWIETGFLVML
jgi:hypothetical protein